MNNKTKPVFDSGIQHKQIELEIEKNKNFNTLISQGIPLLEKYFSTKLEKVEAPKFKWTLLTFGSLLFLSVIGTGILTFYEKISPENFTFLLGILIGSIITLIGDIIMTVQE